jgi:hypothetical protein
MAAIILDFLSGGFTICFNEQFFDGQPSFRLAHQTDGAAVPWPGQDGQLPPNNSGHSSALARQAK